MNEAIGMTAEERRLHFGLLRDFVDRNTVLRWVEFFRDAIESSLSPMSAYHLPTQSISLEAVLGGYLKASNRVLFLDYDGTLMGIQKVPSAAAPSSEILRTLRMLTADLNNYVYVISGRDQGTLESWLGHIPRLGLSAEHGCFLRTIQEPIEKPTWIATVDLQELYWHQDVLPILEYYTERTPGSFIEQKTVSITWHYRLADPEFGSWQAKEVKTHLEHTVASKYSVEVVAGKKNVEVRPKTSNKGEIVKMILERHGGCDFILCAGDDRTDEDMFRAIFDLHPELLSPLHPASADGGEKEWCFTCSVGGVAKKTAAKYRVNTPDQLVSLLMRLGSMISERAGGLTM